MSTKNYTAAECQELFNQLMSMKAPVYTRVSKNHPEHIQLELHEDEKFRQCYKENNSSRSILPKYWFISQYDNLISIYNEQLEWLYPHQSEYENHPKTVFKYSDVNGDVHSKTVKLHNLKALVWDAQMFGKVEELLELEGLFAFGNKGNPNNVQGHHDAAGDVILVTVRVHIMLEKPAPKPTGDPEVDAQKEMNYMQYMSHTLEEENVTTPTVLIPEDKDIFPIEENQILPGLMEDEFMKKVVEELAYMYTEEKRVNEETES